jgi:hypothetical protein
MHTYRVHLTKTMSTTRQVEADDEDAAIRAAFASEDMPSSRLCFQCAGWGTSWSVDEGEWAVAEDLVAFPTGVEKVR